jgi:hypothetical protein
MFNSGGYWEKVKKGELSTIVKRNSHPAPPFLPFCTRSQILSYHDRSGRKIAIVHQYLRPDETLGASGKPDPKLLLHDGIRYHCGAS